MVPPMSPRVLATALLLISACASRGAGPALPTEIPETTQPGDPVVTVLESGAEPRVRPRYRLARGPQAPMVMDVGLSMAVGSKTLAFIGLPLTRMTLSVDVPRIDADGTAFTQAKITAVEVLPQSEDHVRLVEGMRKGMAAIMGMAMEMRVTPRGFVRDVKVTMPPAALPQVQSMMDSLRNVYQQAAVTFPAEPVGVGARWRVVAQIENGPMKMQQTALVTLESADDKHARIAVITEQTAPPQLLNAVGLAPGTSVSLESYSGHGEGRAEIQLDSLTPHASMNLTIEMASIVVANETRSPLQMNMDMAVKVSPGVKP
jgi:hypothetical protein